MFILLYLFVNSTITRFSTTRLKKTYGQQLRPPSHGPKTHEFGQVSVAQTHRAAAPGVLRRDCGVLGRFDVATHLRMNVGYLGSFFV